MTTEGKKLAAITEILRNEVYQADSIILTKLRAELMKLSLHTLEQLMLVVQNRE